MSKVGIGHVSCYGQTPSRVVVPQNIGAQNVLVKNIHNREAVVSIQGCYNTADY